VECNLVELYRRFRGTWNLHSQSWASTPPTNGSIKDLLPALMMVAESSSETSLHFCQTARCHTTRAGFFKRQNYNTVMYHDWIYTLGVSTRWCHLQASGQNLLLQLKKAYVMGASYVRILNWNQGGRQRFRTPAKKKKLGPSGRAERLKILTLNRKDRLSVTEWVGLGLKGLVCTLPRKTKIYAT
jgi:hypothetical protein